MSIIEIGIDGSDVVATVVDENGNPGVRMVLTDRTDFSGAEVEYSDPAVASTVQHIANVLGKSAARNELNSELTELRAEGKQKLTDLRAEHKQELAELREKQKSEIAKLSEESKASVAQLAEELKTAGVEAVPAELKAQVQSYVKQLGKAHTRALLGLTPYQIGRVLK